MIIRRAEINDIPETVNLLEQLLLLHQELDPDYYIYEENYTANLKTWAEQQLNSESQFLIAAFEEENGKTIFAGFISGYIKYLFPWFKIKSVGHISFLAVKKDFQKKGIGRQLEEAAKKWFSLHNLKYIEVYSNEKNGPGLSAWTAYGYQPFNKFLRKKI